MKVLFILLLMTIFVVTYWPSKIFSIIFILLVSVGCLPVFGQISVFLLWKNPKSPGFENSRLTDLCTMDVGDVAVRMRSMVPSPEKVTAPRL